jgi:hypothetical protein
MKVVLVALRGAGWHRLSGNGSKNVSWTVFGGNSSRSVKVTEERHVDALQILDMRSTYAWSASAYGG